MVFPSAVRALILRCKTTGSPSYKFSIGLGVGDGEGVGDGFGVGETSGVGVGEGVPDGFGVEVGFGVGVEVISEAAVVSVPDVSPALACGVNPIGRLIVFNAQDEKRIMTTSKISIYI